MFNVEKPCSKPSTSAFADKETLAKSRLDSSSRQSSAGTSMHSVGNALCNFLTSSQIASINLISSMTASAKKLPTGAELSVLAQVHTELICALKVHSIERVFVGAVVSACLCYISNAIVARKLR